MHTNKAAWRNSATALRAYLGVKPGQAKFWRIRLRRKEVPAFVYDRGPRGRELPLGACEQMKSQIFQLSLVLSSLLLVYQLPYAYGVYIAPLRQPETSPRPCSM